MDATTTNLNPVYAVARYFANVLQGIQAPATTAPPPADTTTPQTPPPPAEGVGSGIDLFA